MSDSVVDLPQPDGPRRVRNEPWGTSRLRSSTARTLPKTRLQMVQVEGRVVHQAGISLAPCPSHTQLPGSVAAADRVPFADVICDKVSPMVARVDPIGSARTDEARIDARIVRVRFRTGSLAASISMLPHTVCRHGTPCGPCAAALTAWQRGTGRWIEDWDTAAEACRASFATLIGASASGDRHAACGQRGRGHGRRLAPAG